VVVAALIAQIRANGETLRMWSVIANSKPETVTEDIVLDGAVARFDQCKRGSRARPQGACQQRNKGVEGITQA